MKLELVGLLGDVSHSNHLIGLSLFRKAAAASRDLASELDFDVNAGGKVELHQSIDRLRRGIDDVEKAVLQTQLAKHSKAGPQARDIA